MWIKNFRHKKIQIGIIFIIIMLSVLLLNASVSMIKSLDAPMEELAKECNSPQMNGYPYFNDQKMITTVINNFKTLDHIKDVQQVSSYYLSEGINKGEQEITSYSALAQYNETVYKDVRVIKGNLQVADYKDNECAIAACLSNEYDIQINDHLTLGVEGKKLDYKVVGIYADPYDMSNAYDNRILVHKLPKIKTLGYTLFFYTDGTASSQIVSDYHDKYGELGVNVNSLQTQVDNSLIAAHIVGGVFMGVGIIMLFVSLIVIYFIIRNVMITDAKKIATYKIMGYSYWDILSMYLRFYAIIIGLASLAGVIASLFVSNYVLNQLFENIGEVARCSILNPGAFTFVGISVFVLSIIYLIIRSMKNIKPVYALNGMSNANSKKKKEYKGNLTIAFSPMGIALRNFTRNKRGAIGVIITSIVTVFAINFAMISVDVAFNMENTNDYWFAFDKSDFLIGVHDKQTLEEAKKMLSENPNIQSYNCNTVLDQGKVLLDYQKGLENTVIYPFIYESYEGLNLPLVEGRNPRNGKEVALTTLVADSLHKSVGDYVSIKLDTDTKVSLLVTGIFQTYLNMGDSCRLTAEVYSENNVDFHYTSMSVYIKEGANREQVIQQVKDNAPSGITVTPREKCFDSIMDMIASPQKAGIPPIMALVLVIGAVNIFSIVLLKNAVNKKTNQIYKSIGYSTRDLIISNLIYVTAIAIIAILVAVPLVIVTYPKVITACLTTFALKEYPMTLNVAHIVLANAAVIVMFTAGTLLSSRSLHKVNVRDLVID
ncbi:MAG: ABC transporter permease [bacterium]|nr:ABC transporter permease [bacterium]